MKTITLILATAASAFSCTTGGDRPEATARKYCSSCHVFPEARLLDKKSWQEGVLPEMAFRMGVDFSRLHTVSQGDFDAVLATLPESPLVTKEEWEAIEEYYGKEAPDSLECATDPDISPLRQFRADTIALPIQGKNLLTLLQYDAETQNLFAGTRLGKLFVLDKSMNVLDSLDTGSPPSALLRDDLRTITLATMGNMDPNDQPGGKIVQIRDGKQTTVIDSLKRPVFFEKADLNNDGADDLVVSAFGNFTGALLAFERKGDSYHRHVVHNFPGTRKTIVRDFNGDGLPDILALITQGNEHVALFTNRGNFRFAYRVLLQFPPVYGSSSIDLVDLNGDGHPDLLYTNGDNADYSPVLKPYHGVRLFLNDGANEFKETWFYPLNGASMARAADFDQDGDVDIAAIAFFPDFENHPGHSFIYFENERGTYKPYYTELAATSRWIAMEILDLDSDHDLDIALASLTFSPGVPDSLVRSWKDHPVSLLALYNDTR